MTRARCRGDRAAEAEAELAVAGLDAGVCATSDWDAWSECSATCGVGMATRRRHFLNRMGLKKCPLVQTGEARSPARPLAVRELVS